MKTNCGAFLVVVGLVVFSHLTIAQTIQLTPAQQQMLNALPAEQRQQAMSALRDLQSQQSPSITPSINEPIETDVVDPLDSYLQALSVVEEPRAMARSRMVINFTASESATPTEVRALSTDPVLQRLVGSHVFVLDESGILSLDGLNEIPLLGLNAEDIERRLEAESSLAMFDIEVNILEQKPIGIEALEPFGYDVFAPKNTSFDAPSSGPVPPDYVLGPGDNVRVQLFGNVNGIYEYEVSRDGILNLPEIGPVTVAGLPFSEFRDDLNNRVAEMLIGTQVSVTMGALRTIRVFILGDANRPGSYVVSGLSTISSALYRSGGISEVGSLRNIQLKRSGRVVARLDLYDLLISGNTANDRRLQPGDVIFIPPVGNTVSVVGAVKRPAIYEVSSKASVRGVVDLAGGLSNDAFAEGVRIERIDIDGTRKIVSVNLKDNNAAAMLVRSGDTLLIPEILPDVDNGVVLSGHVYRQGTFAWRPGLRLTDIIQSPDELKPGVDMSYVLIRRERERGQPIDVLSSDLAAALTDKTSENNVVLQPRDQVFVFSLDLGRQRTILPIVEELQRQATFDRPASQVQIGGNVRAPGLYPLENGMRVSDLIRAGGRLSEEAYTMQAELTRYSVTGGQSRIVETRNVDLAAVLRGDMSADFELAPYDYLSINRIPEWDSTWTVTLEGEVTFPGQYRVKRGETLAEVLKRAGGLTESAFPEGAVFLRESLREREEEQIELLARRLESDLTTLSLQTADTGGADTLTTGRELLEQLRGTKAVGRLVIDPNHLYLDGAADPSVNIELRDGDTLLVPPRSQFVTVIGETQQNTSHLFAPDLSRDDYINLSGGLTRRADKSRIYVVRANGAVVVRNQSRWLGRGGRVEVMPGDTIVVPLDADKIRPLTFWSSVTQILYQGAIAVAAVRTFDN